MDGWLKSECANNPEAGVLFKFSACVSISFFIIIKKTVVEKLK